MPAILRSRIALLALLGAFLIPIGMSSLRGLTHILSCSEEVKRPFTVEVSEGAPQVLSSMRIGRGDTGEICGGLSLDVQARTGRESDSVLMLLPITNNTEFLWRGTVSLEVGGTKVPVEVGKIPAGETEIGKVGLILSKGSTEINGNLLIGP